MEYQSLAADIVQHVGGEKNIVALSHCATRLRFTLKDNKAVNEKALQQLDGVMGIVENKAQFQVIIGTSVHEVCEEIYKQTKIGEGNTEKQSGQKEEGNLFMRLLAIIPRVFTPILPVIMANGLLKALFMVLQICGVLDTASSSYAILNFASDVGFYFLPIFVAVSAAKIFNTNPYMAAMVGALLLHPTWSAMVGAKEAVSLFGLPVALVTYSSTMLPSMIGVWVLSNVERFFQKYIPELLKYVFVPLLTFLVMVVLMLVVIGPIGFYLGDYVAKALMGIYDVSGWLAIVLIAAFKPLLVMTGMHYALTTAFLTMFTATGIDKFYVSASILANLAQSGATFGVFLKSKDAKTKSIALSTSFTAFMGITEPAMFGITLKYKRPFVAAMIGAACGGLYAGIIGIEFISLAGSGITGILGVVPQYFIHIIVAIVITLIVSCVLTIVFGFEEDTKEKETHIDATKKINHHKEAANIIIDSPLTGEIVDLSMVPDPAFSSESIGKGIAILPKKGLLYAPVDGVISACFQTGHAMGITADNGAELLIHVGIDTVQLKGKYFYPQVAQGEHVKKGDLIMEFDLEQIEKAGYQTITPFVITNKNEYMDIFTVHKQKEIQAQEPLLAIIPK